MDYRNNYNNRDYRRSSSSGNKRRAQSVQDVLSPADRGGSRSSSRNRSRSRTGSYETTEFSGGIDSIAGVIFVVLLCVCVLVAVIFHTSGAGRTSGYYPLNVFTINGILNDSYAGLPGVSQAEQAEIPENADSAAAAAAVASAAASAPTTDSTTEVAATGVTGAAMLLDAGGGVDGYDEAQSYADLMTQLEQALATGDANFIGSKIGYTDDSTGTTLGFPQSVVEHFASFMAANEDKRQSFMDMIRDDAKYDGLNGTAHIVNLPMIRYKVTTDYDDTTFCFSGFSEQTINANQEATVSPMLPCMYTVTATCPSWEQPIEGQLEATFGENLEVNFGTN